MSDDDFSAEYEAAWQAGFNAGRESVADATSEAWQEGYNAGLADASEQ